MVGHQEEEGEEETVGGFDGIWCLISRHSSFHKWGIWSKKRFCRHVVGSRFSPPSPPLLPILRLFESQASFHVCPTAVKDSHAQLKKRGTTKVRGGQDRNRVGATRVRGGLGSVRWRLEIDSSDFKSSSYLISSWTCIRVNGVSILYNRARIC